MFLLYMPKYSECTVSANGWYCLSTIKKEDIIKGILLHKRKSQRKGLTSARAKVQIVEAKVDVMEDLETVV